MRGQYFTPREVCDLMLAWGVECASDHLLEPGCGTGAFLVRARDLLAEMAGPDVKILDQLQGVDIDPRAAALCALRLRGFLQPDSRQVAEESTGIMAGDFLSESFPALLSQPPDLVIGNPPYVRHEHMKQDPRFDMPGVRRIFTALYEDYLKSHPEQLPLFSGRGDLSIWFLLQATRLLQPGGRLAFIISNGWLESSQGQSLRRFLLDHYTPLALMESAVEPWFEDAAINPAILMLRRRDEKTAPDLNAPVRLIRFQQPLADWLPGNNDNGNYWSVLRQKIERLKQAKSVAGVELRTVSVSRLCHEPGRSWFFCWRSPRSLLENYADSVEPSRWCLLETVGRVRYPVKTGINRFFYVTPEVAARFSIEPEFLLPVIKSTKELRSPEIRAADLTVRLFSCVQSKEALIRAGKTGALNYIAWGEQQMAPPRQKRGRSVPWPEVSSVQGRPFWYALPPIPPADILCPRFFDRRFVFPVCRDALTEDQTFYGLTLQADFPKDFMAGLLNSLPVMLMTELCGRASLGEGVLQFSREDMARLPVPNPALWDEAGQQGIARCFGVLSQRPVLPVEEELACPDRRLLDERVLAGLFPEKNAREIEDIREEWAAMLVRRVGERTGMAAKRRAKRRMT